LRKLFLKNILGTLYIIIQSLAINKKM